MNVLSLTTATQKGTTAMCVCVRRSSALTLLHPCMAVYVYIGVAYDRTLTLCANDRHATSSASCAATSRTTSRNGGGESGSGCSSRGALPGRIMALLMQCVDKGPSE
jgi:hypothetical protein